MRETLNQREWLERELGHHVTVKSGVTGMRLEVVWGYVSWDWDPLTVC